MTPQAEMTEAQLVIAQLMQGGPLDARARLVLAAQIMMPDTGDPLLDAARSYRGEDPESFDDLPERSFTEGLQNLTDEELRALLLNPVRIQRLREYLRQLWGDG